MPLTPNPPPKDAVRFSHRDAAIERASADTLTIVPLLAIDPALPDRREPKDALKIPSSTVASDNPSQKDGNKDQQAGDFRGRLLAELDERERSLDAISAEIEEHPDQAHLYAQRGCMRLSWAHEKDSDLLKAAIADFDRYLELSPGHLDTRLVRGAALAMAGQHDAALSDLSWVIRHQSAHFEARVLRGKVLMDKGEFVRAIADFDRAASAQPEKVESTLLIYRGRCHAQNGDYVRAIADLTRAMEEFPVETPVWLERARCYQQLGELERARSDIDEVLSLHPDDLSAHFLRVSLLSRMSDDAAAIREADRLRELMPDEPGPYSLRSAAVWQAARKRDRLVAKVDRVAATAEQILPCAPVPHLVRASAAGVVGIGRKGALADLDRCLAIETRASVMYALRAILNAYEGKFVPVCRDIALFALTYDPARHYLFVSVDWDRHRFEVGFGFWYGDNKEKPDQKLVAHELNQKSMDLSFRQLLSAAFGSER
jgi:tetratricopeptide (TPR) repeat protein